MSEDTPDQLPMIGSHPMDEDEASCSPKVYISNEESALLAAMRELRERAVEIRGQLKQDLSDEDRTRLDSELAELRSRRADLAARREEASKRKMIMLGHLPPDDEVKLF